MCPIEPEDLGRIYRERASALILYARQWSPTPEDIVHEAFLSLAAQTVVPINIAAWLHRSVRNAAIDSSRSTQRRRRRESVSAPNEAWFQPTEEGLDAQTAADSLKSLDPELREIIVLKVWSGLTFDEIADLLGTPISTIYRRYKSGLEQLRMRLEGRWTPRTTASPTT